MSDIGESDMKAFAEMGMEDFDIWTLLSLHPYDSIYWSLNFFITVKMIPFLCLKRI